MKQKNNSNQIAKVEKRKLFKAFVNFVIHNILSFSVVELLWINPLLRIAAEIGLNVSPPLVY